MNFEIGFYELMRASHVKRWHIVNTTQQQNLAEHQYNVAVIAMELRRVVVGGEPPVEFVLGAMFHDIPEIRYGDIPTPGKEFIRGVLNDQGYEGEADLFHLMDSAIMPHIPYTGTSHIPAEDDSIITLADMIEAAWWSAENGVGAHAKLVATRLWNQLCAYAIKTGMVDQANHVLQRLSMPYISEETSVLPP